MAVIVDAASFACSGLLIGTIRRREPKPKGATAEGSTELKAGLRFVFAQPTLRTLTIWISVWNFFSSGFFALAIVYYVRDLHLEATAIGVVFAISSAGFVVASFFNDRVRKRFGIGPVIAYSGPLSTPAFWRSRSHHSRMHSRS